MGVGWGEEARVSETLAVSVSIATSFLTLSLMGPGLERGVGPPLPRKQGWMVGVALLDSSSGQRGPRDVRPGPEESHNRRTAPWPQGQACRLSPGPP